MSPRDRQPRLNEPFIETETARIRVSFYVSLELIRNRRKNAIIEHEHNEVKYQEGRYKCLWSWWTINEHLFSCPSLVNVISRFQCLPSSAYVLDSTHVLLQYKLQVRMYLYLYLYNTAKMSLLTGQDSYLDSTSTSTHLCLFFLVVLVTHYYNHI